MKLVNHSIEHNHMTLLCYIDLDIIGCMSYTRTNGGLFIKLLGHSFNLYQYDRTRVMLRGLNIGECLSSSRTRRAISDTSVSHMNLSLLLI